MSHKEFKKDDLDIDQLLETNRRLNRRVSEINSSWQSRAMTAETMLQLWEDHSRRESHRHMVACNELRDIYIMIEKARGYPMPMFHSVLDNCHPDAGNNPGVYANVYITKHGGLRHERVTEAVKSYLEKTKVELEQLREENEKLRKQLEQQQLSIMEK